MLYLITMWRLEDIADQNVTTLLYVGIKELKLKFYKLLKVLGLYTLDKIKA